MAIQYSIELNAAAAMPTHERAAYTQRERCLERLNQNANHLAADVRKRKAQKNISTMYAWDKAPCDMASEEGR